jgi:hypothetical protein
LSIRDNLDTDSNVTEKSDPHREKHSTLKTLTDAGRMISVKPVPTNAHFSIRVNLDPDSNISEVSDLHRRKQLSPMNPTDAGITISINPV